MILKYPVDKKYPITQPFGYDNSKHPIRNNFYSIFDNKHPGIDIELPIGTQVFASHEGIVVRKEFHKGMGNVLATRYKNIVILYAHLASLEPELGTIISQGDLIGTSGDTGGACVTPHLHFELRDISINSLKEMVFEPVFNSQIPQLTSNFIYKINNKNTVKNLLVLSKMYFGSEIFWEKIKEVNRMEQDKDEQLNEGTELLIPNYM